MNPLLLKTAQFFARRPKDSTIRMFHILSGLVIIELIYFSATRSVLDIPFIGVQKPEIENKIQLGLLVIGLFPLLKGLFSWCMMKHRTLRIAQGLL